jgi:hypothetical protein
MSATFSMDMKDDYRVMFRFCPVCGAALESRLLKQGEPARLVCVACEYVHYLDPKLAVGTIITDDRRRVVLVKRAIEPVTASGCFPAGMSTAVRKCSWPQCARPGKKPASMFDSNG